MSDNNIHSRLQLLFSGSSVHRFVIFATALAYFMLFVGATRWSMRCIRIYKRLQRLRSARTRDNRHRTTSDCIATPSTQTATQEAIGPQNSPAHLDQYRPLGDGEFLLIGDEYNCDGQWVPITEEEFTQWCGACTTYNPDEMPPMRRSIPVSFELLRQSQEILQRAHDEYFYSVR